MPRQTPLTGQDVLKFFLNENPGSPLVVKQKFLVVVRDHSYITSALVGGEGRRGQKMQIFAYS